MGRLNFKNSHSHSGFTILEVMLVLAITFLIFIAMTGTIQISISRQRYNDSVTSFQDFLQRQYSEVQNVVVDEGGNRIAGCGDKRGRSDCYVIGRLLTFVEVDGYSAVNVDQIVYITDDTSGGANVGGRKKLKYDDYDLTDVVGADIKTNGTRVEQYSFEWGAKAYRPNKGNSFKNDLSIFIFRSPETGTIRTYVKTGSLITTSKISSMLGKKSDPGEPSTTPTTDKNLDICVVADGAVFTPNRAVRINSGASSASAIELPVPGKNEAAGEVDCER
ncbi:MAG: prepilin-type N-terminal cleavage/methylation domain-containing protein [Candidatus Saccharibacteria bacterium]|nr:prepilin-type N-terminal cleavage/methylation domain-containing protein [Candidatus Saccharibacteria bacterium]